MKKINIFLFGALAIAAASCENDITFDAPMQEVPQGPVFETGNISAAVAGPIAQGSLDLNNYVDKTVEVVTLNSVDSLLSAGEVYFKLEIANNADFTGEKVLDVKMSGNTGSVSAEELNADHIQLFGKSPSPKEVYYRIPAYVKMGGTDYRWGGTDYYVAAGTYSEVCIDAGFSISNAYYFVGNLNGWQLDETLKFDHSSADVYDDPVFTITLTFDEGASYWKIAPQEAIDDQNWDALYGPETDGDTSLEGMLVEGGGAGEIMEAGTYKLTINMETMEYTFTLFTRPLYLCTPGGANGWNQGASSWLDYSEGKGYFCGAVREDDGFKLTAGNTWDNDKTWGMGAEEGVLAQPGDNIPVPAAGLYWVTANVEGLTYTNTAITSIGVVGGLNGWAADAPIELIPNDDQSVWAADVDLTGEWKIIINHSWDSNYGNTVEQPIFDAGNISGYEGTYNVAVDFTGNYPVITLTAL